MSLSTVKRRVPVSQPDTEMDTDAHKYVGTVPRRLLWLLPKISWSANTEMKISTALRLTDFLEVLHDSAV